MNTYKFFSHFLDTVGQEFPELAFLQSEPSMVPLFVSGAVVPVSSGVLDTCVKFIQNFRTVVDHSEYRTAVQKTLPTGFVLGQPDSALLCFDFYVTPEGPRLIEINTNGAGYPTIALLYASHTAETLGINAPTAVQAFSRLREMFVREWGEFSAERSRVVIVDDAIFSQRTLFEFKTYQALFRSWGYDCDIVDMADLHYVGERLMAHGKPVHLVYNRCCDFYLAEPSSAVLARAVADPAVCVTPHPSSYALMADKARMVMLSDPDRVRLYGGNLSLFSQCIPPVFDIQDHDPAYWWERRRSLFFKPKNTYGSKAVYKGASISRKKFDGLVVEPYVVQPYFDADTLLVPEIAEPFKYDLRFFVYGSDILLVGARIFQGQVTNFQTIGGGFAPVCVGHG